MNRAAVYVTRRRITKELEKHSNFKWQITLHLPFSNRTIVCQRHGAFSSAGRFYTDLSNPAYKSAFAIYHRRFSTNTMPAAASSADAALGHNGEINTLLGNIN